MPEPTTETTVDLNGVRLYTRRAGEGPPADPLPPDACRGGRRSGRPSFPSSVRASRLNLTVRAGMKPLRLPPRFGLADVAILCLVGGVIATVVAFAREFEAPFVQAIQIDLRPT